MKTISLFFISTGDKWYTRRRLITPSFHFDILKDFLLVMSEQADIFVSVLRKFAKTGKEFDIFPLISNCALDIICGKINKKFKFLTIQIPFF